MGETIRIKCVAIGDGYVGKTSLLARLANKELEQEYAPTVFDNCSVEVNRDGRKYNLHLIDTAGQEDYEYLRQQAYSETDVFLLCFSVTNMTSFSNVRQHWIPELSKLAEGSAYLLVGTKSDLRDDPETIDRMNVSNEIFVSKEAALNLAKSYNVKYVECSSRTTENIQEILNSVITVGISRRKMSGGKCCSQYLYIPVINAIKKAFCCNKYSA